jgi:hypothetical protein
MLEIGITFSIILFFTFPVPCLAFCLGSWTCHLIYRKILLLKFQPTAWGKIVWVHFLTGALDTILSAIMAMLLSLTVYFLIFDSLRLFIFNFIFCFLISFRWFDFTQGLYRHLVLKLQTLSLPPPKNGVFCMLIGQRPGNGWGLGMKSISLDSGYIYWDGVQMIFDGVMARRKFTRKEILTVEKMSSEKIKIVPVKNNLNDETESWVLVLRQQFYPFKSRELRDQWFERLSGIQEVAAPEYELPAILPSQIPSA